MNEGQIKTIEPEKKDEPKENPNKIVSLPTWSIEPPLEIKRDNK